MVTRWAGRCFSVLSGSDRPDMEMFDVLVLALVDTCVCFVSFVSADIGKDDSKVIADNRNSEVQFNWRKKLNVHFKFHQERMSEQIKFFFFFSWLVARPPLPPLCCPPAAARTNTSEQEGQGRERPRRLLGC